MDEVDSHRASPCCSERLTAGPVAGRRVGEGSSLAALSQLCRGGRLQSGPAPRATPCTLAAGAAGTDPSQSGSSDHLLHGWSRMPSGHLHTVDRSPRAESLQRPSAQGSLRCRAHRHRRPRRWHAARWMHRCAAATRGKPSAGCDTGCGGKGRTLTTVEVGTPSPPRVVVDVKRCYVCDGSYIVWRFSGYRMVARLASSPRTQKH